MVKTVSVEIEYICPKCQTKNRIKTWVSEFVKYGLLEGTRRHTCESCYEEIYWYLILSPILEEDRMPPELKPTKCF